MTGPQPLTPTPSRFRVGLQNWSFLFFVFKIAPWLISSGKSVFSIESHCLRGAPRRKLTSGRFGIQWPVCSWLADLTGCSEPSICAAFQFIQSFCLPFSAPYSLVKQVQLLPHVTLSVVGNLVEGTCYYVTRLRVGGSRPSWGWTWVT